MNAPGKDLNQIFINNLNALCAERGITSDQLSEKSGIALEQVKRIRDGKEVEIDLRTFQRIADALGVSYDSLLK